MPGNRPASPDLTPPAFDEGLCDWSREDGTHDSLAYDTAPNCRLARNDPEFGNCLEVRKIDPVQRIRYKGEMPLPRGAFIEIAVRIKAVRGPLPQVRIAAFAGGMGAVGIEDLPLEGPIVDIKEYETIHQVSAVIGPQALDGVDMVWDARALYAHVGLDILGPDNSVIRIENFSVREVTLEFLPGRIPLPGFEPEGYVLP